MSVRLAFLSQGKLFFKDKDLPASQINSAFGQEVINREIRIQQSNEWKTKGPGAQFAAGGMVWAADQADSRAMRIHITGVTKATDNNQLLYFLDTDNVGGLFEYDLESGDEKRLFHRQNILARDLSGHKTLPLIACSMYFPNGTANIAILSENESRFNPVTEGDSVDEAPSWAPGKNRQLLFQSAGIGRNSNGICVGIGPSAIHKLDLDTGEIETLLEDSAYDFILPRMNKEGDLFFIRRPYEASGQISLIKSLSDFVKFPFRLISAFLHFLNVFSMTFSNKPLMTAGGPKRKGPDIETIMLRGRVIKVKNALDKPGKDDGAGSVVPKNWELVKLKHDGKEEVLAKGVAAFDLSAENHLAFSDGRAVCLLRDGEDKPKKVSTQKFVDSVVFV